MFLITLLGTLRALIASPTRDTLAKRVRWLKLYSELWNPIEFVEEDGLRWLVPRTIDMTAIGRYEDYLQPIITFDKHMVFLDIGAAVGRYSIRAAMAGATVHAWEPVKRTRERLRANILLNGLDEEMNLYRLA